MKQHVQHLRQYDRSSVVWRARFETWSRFSCIAAVEKPLIPLVMIMPEGYRSTRYGYHSS